MTYDLDSARSSYSALTTRRQSLGKDPLRSLENRMRWAVLVLAFAVLVLSIAAVGAVVNSWS